ncbi:hypothetical protein [Halomonas sp. BC1]|uniref:hypothetical protein n=1 Tax=Halomonas sp. BC1 TaxID=1670448 RepID=UPI001119C85A|nr:hypothetical protein [Halomonas sp. BC1]
MLCLLNEIYNNSGQFFFGSEIEESKAYIDKLRVGVIALFSGKGEVVSDVDFFRIENEFKESNMKVGVKWFGDEFAIVNKKNDLTSNNESYCPPLDNNHLNLLEEVFVFLEKIDFQYHKKIDHLAPVFRDIAVMRERKSLNISYRWMTLAWRIRPNGPIINKKLDEYKTRRHSFFYHLNEFLKVIFTSTK